jgi:hypothetical protein
MHPVTLVAGVMLMAAALSPAFGDEPLTLAASNVGRFSKGGSWHLSVHSAGRAELTTASATARCRIFSSGTAGPGCRLWEYVGLTQSTTSD